MEIIKPKRRRKMAKSIIQSMYNDTIDHVFSNVAQIKAFFETFTADNTGEFHEILTVVHTDSSEMALRPHVRWTGILSKDNGGHTITFTASCYFGQIAIITRDPLGEWKTYLINGTQAS